MRARRCVGVAICVLLATARVAAEPAPIPTEQTLVQTREPRLLCKPPAPPTVCIELPPGRFVDEQTWLGIDDRAKTTEDALTRALAENKSLRESAKDWRPGWVSLSAAVVSGIALGIYIAK